MRAGDRREEHPAAARAGEAAVPEQAAPSGTQQRAPEVVPPRRGGPAASGDAATGPAPTGHRRRRRAWMVAVAVIVVAAGVAEPARPEVFHTAKPVGDSSGYSTKTYAVTRSSLTSQTQENATLGNAGSYTVVVPGSSSGSGGTGSPSSGSGASGTFTWLPAAGQTIRQGQVIYKVSETPVVLLYGSVPAYRDLSEGMTGGDVLELNTDLVKLGYATAAALGPGSGWDYFSGETAYALEQLQSHLGLTVDRVAAAGPGGVPARRDPGDRPGHRGGAGGHRRGRDGGADRQLADPGGDHRPRRLPADRGEDRRQGVGHPAGRGADTGGDLRDQHRGLVVLVVLLFFFVVLVVRRLLVVR